MIHQKLSKGPSYPPQLLTEPTSFLLHSGFEGEKKGKEDDVHSPTMRGFHVSP